MDKTGKTVFQEFADFLAKSGGDRDATFETTHTANTFVITRVNPKV